MGQVTPFDFFHLKRDMTLSLISCVVPVFNGERYLAEAIESILNQTYRPIEIIVVDDGSTDGTAAVAARYGDRIRYVKQDNGGPPTARNLGLRMAAGDFVAFLDSDDLWHPEKLQRQMACFEARADLDLCVTHLQRFWVPQLEAEQKRFQHHRYAEVLPGYVTQTLLARRTLFDSVGRFDTSRRVGDPMDWFLRAGEMGAVMELLSDLLVYQRMHEKNLSVELHTRRMTPSMQNAILDVVKASLDRRRRQSETGPVSLQFPASSWRKKT
jgi:glycosyltransferase involved in cell wall biosynthesis